MTTPQNSEIINQLKVTNTIYYSMITGVILFFIVVMVFIQSKDPSEYKELNEIFRIVVPLIGLMTMFVSRMVYNKMVSKNTGGDDLLKKITDYRTAKIVSWAMIDGACFFSLVAAMITADYLYIAVFIFLFGYFFLMKPSKESFIRDMRLSSEESDRILKS
jgi:predicted membrane channel-forming protein YqfA (hemolysin III family)